MAATALMVGENKLAASAAVRSGDAVMSRTAVTAAPDPTDGIDSLMYHRMPSSTHVGS